MANVEPFSYFRQRTVYEPNRSWKGRRTDKKLGSIYEQIQKEPEEKPLESDSICQI